MATSTRYVSSCASSSWPSSYLLGLWAWRILSLEKCPKGSFRLKIRDILSSLSRLPVELRSTTLGKSVQQVTEITKNIPEVLGTFAVAGFSFGGATPNAGIVFLTLQPYEKRKGENHTAAAIIERLRGPLFGISGAFVIPFEPPAVQGLGQFGGFQYELQDQGTHTLQDLDKTMHDLIRAAGERKEKDLTGLFSTYTSNDPQYVVTIDREKAKSLHVPLGQITNTLSVFMGSAYVNDFDFNNRSYRVYVQADKQFRSHPQNIGQYYVRSDAGAWFHSPIW